MPTGVSSWNGRTVEYACYYDQVDYSYVGQLEAGNAHPHVDGCHTLDEPYTPVWYTDPPAWAVTMHQVCRDECSIQVEEEAASMGRTVLDDTCDDLPDGQYMWTRRNCDDTSALEQEQRLELSYAPLVGDRITVEGTATYTVAYGRVGSTLTLQSLELDEPLVLVSSVRQATALLGYPIGTVIEVDRVMSHPVSVPVSRGRARIPAEDLRMAAFITLTEPDEAPVALTVGAASPFDLVVSTRSGLSVSSWGDGFGGTFTARQIQ